MGKNLYKNNRCLTKKAVFIIFLIILAFFIFIPNIVQAANFTDLWRNLGSKLASGKFVMEDVPTLATNIIDLLLYFATWITMVFLIIGGYLYITASGNPEALERAKKTISGTIVAFIIIIVSKVIVTFIEGYLKKYSFSSNLSGALASVINMMLYPVGFIAILGLIIGGFQYTTAQVNPEKIEKAKKAILYSSLGLIVIILSWSILYFICQRFGLSCPR